jgi:hypothetical protein
MLIKIKCDGKINTLLSNSGENFHGYCPICQINGEIKNGEGTQLQLLNK